MMKWITIFFLLINVAFFGWRLNQQMAQPQTKIAENAPKLASTEKLVLLSEMDALPPLRKDSRFPEEESGANQTVDETELLQQIPASVNDGTCMVIGPFNAGQEDDDRISIKNWLSVRAIPVSEHVIDVRTRERYWVYLEPKATEAEARAQVEQLKQQGVSDYYMVTKGDMKNAISLGLFSSQESVNRRLEELAKEGYQPVVVPQHKVAQQVFIQAQLTQEQTNLSLPDLPESIKVENKPCSEIALH